ncbi:MAG: T9SS type A sorting domain-containing protein [Saprospiraceae bacterium]|nr:T9SS type A sorting domain-containing protein [Saprospiraceae bacterium]
MITFSIFSLLGRQSSRQTISNGASADIAALPNGLYLLTATTPLGRVFLGKFYKAGVGTLRGARNGKGEEFGAHDGGLR